MLRDALPAQGGVSSGLCRAAGNSAQFLHAAVSRMESPTWECVWESRDKRARQQERDAVLWVSGSGDSDNDSVC